MHHPVQGREGRRGRLADRNRKSILYIAFFDKEDVLLFAVGQPVGTVVGEIAIAGVPLPKEGVDENTVIRKNQDTTFSDKSAGGKSERAPSHYAQVPDPCAAREVGENRDRG